MPPYSQTVYVVATSFDYGGDERPDYDRLTTGFDHFNPEKAYLLTNRNPRGATEKLEARARDRIATIIRENTPITGTDLHVEEVDFYDVRAAFYRSYEIFYREKHRNNPIQINLSGGPKPLAIGVSHAAAMLDVQHRPVYIAKRYEMGDDGLETPGVVDSDDVVHLDLFDVSDPVPDWQLKADLLHFFYEYADGPIGVTSLLEKAGEIDPIDKTSNKRDRKDERDTYYSPRDELQDEGLLDKHDREQKWRLTDRGEHVARLANIRHEVRNENDTNEDYT